jgi:hypothetical protein
MRLVDSEKSISLAFPALPFLTKDPALSRVKPANFTLSNLIHHR